MKAIQVQNDKLIWVESADPTLRPGEVVIDVHATAINRADLAQRRGGYPPPNGAGSILGLECAGTVSAVADGVTAFRIGDAVCGLLAGGGYAEKVAVPAGQVLPLPQGMSFIEAAAIPEVFATAYLNIFVEANAQSCETVLLHAGASGVGTAAIQLCRAFTNPCFVTAGSQAKINRCIALGAVDGVDRNTQNFRDRVEEWTHGNGFDIILDPVGASYLQDNLTSLNLDGRLVVIGLMGGADTEISLGRMMMKRLRVIGSTLRARSIEAKTALMDEMYERVWPLFESRTIKPVIETTMNIRDADEAHALLHTNDTVGKVVLTVD